MAAEFNNGKPAGSHLSWLLQNCNPGSDECVLWPFFVHPKTGYGRVQYAQKGSSAHRVACIYIHGNPSSDSMHAAHSCRNRSCVNAGHLRWATSKENMGDKAKDGTKGIGQSHPYAKLTKQQVDEIKIRYYLGDSQRTLGRAYGVHRTNIHRIVSGDTWRGQ